MRHIFLTTIILYVSMSAAGQWAYVGLSGKKINSLRVNGSSIYAATADGLYKKDVAISDTNWTLIGFPGKEVNCVEIVTANRIYAGISHSGTGADTLALFFTDNSGGNWIPKWGAYSSFSTAYVQIGDIEVLPGVVDTIIVAGDGIWKSVNGGMSFSFVNITGGRFLSIAPSNTNMLWTGGEGVLLDPYLIQTTTKGHMWFYNDSLKQVVSGDNACLSAAVHPKNHNTVYVGMEGQVAKSTDNGMHWNKILSNNYYMKGIMVSPSDEKTIYATGGTFGGKEIPLFVSTNEGSTWDTLKYYVGPALDVLEMTVSNTTGKDVVYYGTRNHGIYKYETSITAVQDIPESFSLPIIYPNPFSAQATVHFNNRRNELIDATITDVSGRVIGTQKIKSELFMLNRCDMVAGAYILTLTNKAGEKQVLKFEVE